MERLGANLDEVITRDELLDNVMIHWLTGTGASSARLYWESIRQVDSWISDTTGEPVTAPTGCTIFPKELQRPSRRWAQNRFPNIRLWLSAARQPTSCLIAGVPRSALAMAPACLVMSGPAAHVRPTRMPSWCGLLIDLR